VATARQLLASTVVCTENSIVASENPIHWDSPSTPNQNIIVE
jgi:hypothetical protein